LKDLALLAGQGSTSAIMLGRRFVKDALARRRRFGGRARTGRGQADADHRSGRFLARVLLAAPAARNAVARVGFPDRPIRLLIPGPPAPGNVFTAR
jgi:hypothetical protein